MRFNGTGSGRIVISTNGAVTQTCSSTCLDDGAPGRALSLAPQTPADTVFVGFSGPCTSSSDPFNCPVDLSADRTIDVQFASLTGAPTGGRADRFGTTQAATLGPVTVAAHPSGGAVLAFASNTSLNIAGIATQDAVVLQQAADGGIAWVRSVDLGSSGFPTSLVVRPDGTVWLGAHCSSGALPAGAMLPSGGCLVELLDGGVRAARTLSPATVASVAVDSTGQLAASGEVTGTFAPNGLALTKYGPASQSGGENYVLRFGADGGATWGARIGGPYDDGAAVIAFDTLDRLVVAGHVRSAFSFGGVSFNGGQFAGEGYVARFTAAGALDTVARLAAQYEVFVYSVGTGPGRVFVSGTYEGTAGFSGALPIAPSITGNTFVGALNDSFSPQWFKAGLGLYDAHLVSDGSDVVVAAHYESGGNWGSGWSIGGDFTSSSTLARFDANGTLGWVLPVASSHGTPSLALGPGTLIIGGLFDGQLNLGTRPTWDGTGSDVYLATLPR